MNALNKKYSQEKDNEKEISNDEQIKTCLKHCFEFLEKEFLHQLGPKFHIFLVIQNNFYIYIIIIYSS